MIRHNWEELMVKTYPESFDQFSDAIQFIQDKRPDRDPYEFQGSDSDCDSVSFSLVSFI